jgi:2-aminoethylphosphonate-pyruvate transaminase
MASLDYDLVVFDLAGTTVVDTGDIVAVCLCRAIEATARVKVSHATAVSLMGIPKPTAVRRLLQEQGLEASEVLVADAHAAFIARMLEYYRHDPSVAEIPGTSRMFAQLHEAGVKVGVDTGFSRDITDAIIDRLGWARRGLVDASAASDEVAAGRPAPFMIYRLMEQLRVSDVRRVVKVGDTPSDLNQGANARCGRIVGVTAGSHTRAQLRPHPHTDLIHDINELIDTLRRDPRPDLQLHTPGPANTSSAVRAAMGRDIGAWDRELIDLAADIRRRLLAAAGVRQQDGWESVLVQGSGTFGVEATIGSAVPRGGKLLVAVNGAYGERIVTIGRTLGIDTVEIRFEEDQPIDPATLVAALHDDPGIDSVAVVHCETTTGLMSDITAIGQALRAARPDVTYVVDAMSSFGAHPIDLEACGIDWIVASSNKCIQGVPGFAFAIARRERLEASKGHARSLSLDLYDQWRGFETHGRFRYTPPTHVLLAFQQALAEFEAEGGVAARHARYCSLQRRLAEGMAARGYRALLPASLQSPIITTFLYPDDPAFKFQALYAALHDRGFVIYPGKLTHVNCFRIGHIGHIVPADIDRLLAAIDDATAELGFDPRGATRRTAATETLA